MAYLKDPPLDDERAPARPLRAKTLKQWEFTLRYYGSVVIRAGVAPEALTRPADLLKPAHIDALLKHFDPEQPDRGPVSYRILLENLLKIGRYTGKLTPKTKARLKRLRARAGSPSHGMTPRNRRMVMLLKDPKVTARVVTLPPRVFDALRAEKSPSAQDASVALAALIVEFLLMFGPRIANIAMIRLDKHIVRAGGGKTTTVRVVFDSHEVKNGKELDARLPVETVRLLDEFIARYRPLLFKGQSPYLFPAKNGGQRSSGTLWTVVKKITKKFAGIPMNPHLFRHFGVALFLMAQPGLYEIPRLVLGHQSLDMLAKHYAGTETEQALEIYDANVLQVRKNASLALARSRGRRKAAAKRTRSSTQRGRKALSGGNNGNA